MASHSFRRFVELELGKFPHFMIFGVLECILIILLFLDGLLAFLANEFAKFFDLKLPCLLCTRIDHFLVRKTPCFYYNESICEAHKKDISYLAYCHAHEKLSDVRKMCEGCLLSFASEKESDTVKSKSLDGIMHKDLERLIEDDDHQIQMKSPMKISVDDVKVENHHCSCCGVQLKVKSNNGSSAKKKGVSISSTPVPSPRASFVSLKNEETSNLELSHIRYSELKFNSDNEPESSIAVSTPLLRDFEDLTEDSVKTPISSRSRANRFFGVPLRDSISPSASPRWTSKILKKSPLEKMDFASLESIEASASSIEVDGESILHRLKRQVRLDRKSLMALYMELDEERSASAVAANNAMAMITRLQAEKAAVQMEALQYQRMMEEQAEYDQEALQVMRDMLTKKEREDKTLDGEIEGFREKYGTYMGEDGFEYQVVQSLSQCNSPCGVGSKASLSRELSDITDRGKNFDA